MRRHPPLISAKLKAAWVIGPELPRPPDTLRPFPPLAVALSAAEGLCMSDVSVRSSGSCSTTSSMLLICPARSRYVLPGERKARFGTHHNHSSPWNLSGL